jgi:circadian clock protein KaiC
MTIRMIDYLKLKHITAFFTYLAGNSLDMEHKFISSLIDTWLLIRDMEEDGIREHGIFVLKSRGMSHSNKIRKLILSDEGISIR